MVSPQRLVLFVEGDGEVEAACTLVKQILTNAEAWDILFLDPNPMRVGGIGKLVKNNGEKWKNYLQAARKRPNTGGVLLLLDGDTNPNRKEPFCPVTFATQFAEWSMEVRGSQDFSVATVFALQEFESWLIACSEQLAGLPLSPDGQNGILEGTIPPKGDLEVAPRDAKGWLDKHMIDGYKPTRDQLPVTQLAIKHLQIIRERQMRSFQRLENAVNQLVEAIQDGKPIVSPANPTS